jgi:hypothetical protein
MRTFAEWHGSENVSLEKTSWFHEDGEGGAAVST